MISFLHLMHKTKLKLHDDSRWHDGKSGV